MRYSLLLPLFCLWLPTAQATEQQNDFPTLDRMQFVYECMATHGGQRYESMYQCVCMIDQIANQLSYAEYEEADLYRRMRRASGERGGMFRGTDKAREMRGKLEEAQVIAEKNCIVAPVSSPEKTGSDKSAE